MDDVDRDDVERARVADFDDIRFTPAECPQTDDVFDFAGFGVSLSFDNLAREDDVFEVNDREVVIFELFGSVAQPPIA
ncbi:MAG: hypothetical protein ABI612_03620 [Betaproteobacteria bacterium]